jgi:hypothetical protein
LLPAFSRSLKNPESFGVPLSDFLPGVYQVWMCVTALAAEVFKEIIMKFKYHYTKLQ